LKMRTWYWWVYLGSRGKGIGKLKLSLCFIKHHGKKTCRGSECTVSLIPSLGTRWRWLVASRKDRFILWERAPSTHRIWWWVGPRVTLDVWRTDKSSPLPGIKSRLYRRPSRNLITIL
jgi:hypothetical protein